MQVGQCRHLYYAIFKKVLYKGNKWLEAYVIGNRKAVTFSDN